MFGDLTYPIRDLQRPIRDQTHGPGRIEPCRRVRAWKKSDLKVADRHGSLVIRVLECHTHPLGIPVAGNQQGHGEARGAVAHRGRKIVKPPTIFAETWATKSVFRPFQFFFSAFSFF